MGPTGLQVACLIPCLASCQAGSLVPYLIFLYFVCQDVNGLDRAAKAGFVSLLAFVTATVVASIIAKTQYGTPP